MDQLKQLSWDLLQDVLAIAKQGGIRAAAKSRGVSHAALSRHMAQLEQLLGTPITIRMGRGVTLSEAGQDLAATAERIEAEVDACLLRLAGTAFDVSGTVRVALPPLLVGPLGPVLTSLQSTWPELTLELVASLGVANLTKREADIAIRVQTEPDAHLVGRRIGNFDKAVFKSRHLGLPEQPEDWPWIDWDLGFRHFDSSQWLHRVYPKARIVARVDNAETMLQMVRTGVGVAVLPCIATLGDKDVTRCAETPLPEAVLWVLTHPDLRQVPRVKVVMTAIADHLKGLIQTSHMG